MKRSLFIRYMIVSCLMAILLPFQVMHAVTWIDSTTSDVVDTNLTIDGSAGDVFLPVGSRRIQAATQNVTVSLVNNPVVVGSPIGASNLYLSAAAGLTITFNLNTASSNLMFNGSSDAALDPLTIVAGGPGKVIFNIQGNNELELSSTTTNGGVQFYLLLDPNTSNLIFQRDNGANTNANALVTIGTNSLLSYLSPLSNVSSVLDTGNITFSPANAGTGRYVLTIENTGGFIVTPAFTSTGTLFAINQSTINRTILAGGAAFANVLNNQSSSVSSSLLVVDGNTQLFDLLYDPFFNLGAREDTVHYSGTFSGNRYGFVLGANAILNIENNSYWDHVGTATDQCVTVSAVPGFPGISTQQLIKARNPSAFFVDGSNAPGATPATIQFGEPAALFFRSGVGNDGTINGPGSTNPYVVAPLDETPGIGFCVFDVEAPVIILDPNYPTVGNLNNKFELLSLFVQPTGGSLFVGSGQTIFPLRTFATDLMGQLLQYNKGYFLINNQVYIYSTVFMHTDALHHVYQKNDVLSEPAYIGGEQFTLASGIPRPKFQFNASQLQIHTNAAFTGVDLLIPQSDLSISDTTVAPDTCIPNLSQFVFFYNGYKIDQGTGRYLNLGTAIGSTPCNSCCGSISADAHLDVIQTNTCTTPMLQELQLIVAPNDGTITQGLVGNITGQFSIQTIFLGNASNISVGEEGSTPIFGNETHPILDIAGNFFTFETRGGYTNTPELSNVSGMGGIFVDRNGTFTIEPNVRAHMGAMVTKSANGIVNLPRNQVYFDDNIGIAQWQLDLNQSTTIIGVNDKLAEYSLNWINITKDYDIFTPYELDSVNTCSCPPVVQANITAIPTILGQVNQLTVQGSRLGDQVHLLVDGGWVRELLFQPSNYTAAAATGLLVVQNSGRVGISTAHRNTASLEASFVLGVNGLSIVANGNGEIDLNEDIIVNNICSILKGPDFQPGNVLTFNADTPKTFRVTQDGILDLRSFDAVTDVIQFAGQVKMILEAGAQIWMNGVTVQFADDAIMFAEPFEDAQTIFNAIPHALPHNPALNPFNTTPAANTHNQYAPLQPFGAGLQNTDSFRVKLIGSGTFEFINESTFVIPQNAFVGVESLFEFNGTFTCEIPVTDVAVVLLDDAQMLIGSPGEFGGNFQVGNTTNNNNHSVSFTLSLQGSDAVFMIRSQGFVGFGVGIVDKRFPNVNDWAIDTTFNVSNINISLGNGKFQHNRIFPGDNPNASLLAIALYTLTTPVYTLVFVDTATNEGLPRASDISINGGGNIALIHASSNAGQPGALHPVITDDTYIPISSSIITPVSWNTDVVVVQSGSQTNPAQIHQRMHVGVLNSRPMIPNQDQILVGPETFFTFLQVQYFQAPGPGLGRAASALANEQYASFLNPLATALVDARTATGLSITGGVIGRMNIFDVDDFEGGTPRTRVEQAADLGAVSFTSNITAANPNPPAPVQVVFAQQLPD